MTPTSLNYHNRSSATWENLFLYIVWQVTKQNGPEFVHPTRTWIDERMLCPLVRLSGHCALEVMFKSALWRLQDQFNHGSGLAVPNVSRLHLELVYLLSVRSCAWLDVMIRKCGHRRCMGTSPPNTAAQAEVTRRVNGPPLVHQRQNTQCSSESWACFSFWTLRPKYCIHDTNMQTPNKLETLCCVAKKWWCTCAWM